MTQKETDVFLDYIFLQGLTNHDDRKETDVFLDYMFLQGLSGSNTFVRQNPNSVSDHVHENLQF